MLEQEWPLEQIWRIQMLGRLRVSLGKWEAGALHRRKSGAILAYLAFHQAQLYTRETLVTQFWPEADTETSQNRFRVALSLLRQQLTPPDIPTFTPDYQPFPYRVESRRLYDRRAGV